LRQPLEDLNVTISRAPNRILKTARTITDLKDHRTIKADQSTKRFSTAGRIGAVSSLNKSAELISKPPFFIYPWT
jgi:hypothetical protein